MDQECGPCARLYAVSEQVEVLQVGGGSGQVSLEELIRF